MPVTISFTNDANAPTTNIVQAAASLPVSVFYNSSNDSLFRYKTINGQVVAEVDPNFTTSYSTIRGSFNTVINSTMNASNADPFNLTKYISTPYRVYPNFGSLALGSYTHYLFGNTNMLFMLNNRNEIVNNFNNESLYSHALANTIINFPSNCVKNIAEQIIVQDSNRSNNSSNWSALEFKTDDIIYFTLSLSLSTIKNGTGQEASPSVSNYPGISYHIATTLA